MLKQCAETNEFVVQRREKTNVLWIKRRISKSYVSVVLCVIVFCGASPLRTRSYCFPAEQSALRGGVPFHLVLAETPTLNNCSHSGVEREALAGSVGTCVSASVCVCVWWHSYVITVASAVCSHYDVTNMVGGFSEELTSMNAIFSS